MIQALSFLPPDLSLLSKLSTSWELLQEVRFPKYCLSRLQGLTAVYSCRHGNFADFNRTVNKYTYKVRPHYLIVLQTLKDVTIHHCDGIFQGTYVFIKTFTGIWNILTKSFTHTHTLSVFYILYMHIKVYMYQYGTKI